MGHNDRFIEGKFVLSIPPDKYPGTEQAKQLSYSLVRAIEPAVVRALGLDDSRSYTRELGLGIDGVETAPELFDLQEGKAVPPTLDMKKALNMLTEAISKRKRHRVKPEASGEHGSVKGQKDLEHLFNEPCPGCGEVHSDQEYMVMHAECHPSAPLEAAYFRTGMVVIRCAICHKTVEALAVAKEGGPGIGYINTETSIQ